MTSLQTGNRRYACRDKQDDPHTVTSQHGQVHMSDHIEWNEIVVSSLVTDGFIDAGFHKLYVVRYK